MTDRELLERFTTLQDRGAIDTLVRRYVDLVYASARRQVGDPHLAEDITQAVFLTLARKARLVMPDRLAGWLFTATRYAAANARKTAARRRYHERHAARQRPEILMETGPANPDPQELISEIDNAIASLGPKDREMVIRRFFQGGEIADVCSALGVSEGAARKRIERAVEKLRKFFVRRGLAMETGPILTAISVAAAQKATPLTASLASSAAWGSASPAVVSVCKAIGVMTAMARVKVAAAVLAAVVFATTVATLTVRYMISVDGTAASMRPTPSGLLPPVDDAKRELERVHLAMVPKTRQYYSAFHADSYVERYDAPNQRPTDSTDTKIYRDGENVDVFSRLQMHWPGHKPVDSTVVTRLIAAASFVEYEPNEKVPPKRGLFNPDGSALRSIPIAYLRGGDVLEGYLAGDDRPFWEILAQYSGLRMAIETEAAATQPAVPAKALVHISGDGFSGVYDLWCDPQSHALLDAKVVKHEGSKVWHSVTLGKPVPPSTSQILDQFWFEMTIKPRDDGSARTMPDETQFVTYQHYTNGHFVKQHMTVRRTAFEAEPDFVGRGAFRPELAEGARLGGLNLPGGGRFVWQRGSIELVAGTSPPGSLQAALQTNAPGLLPTRWSILGGASSPPASAAILSSTAYPAPNSVPHLHSLAMIVAIPCAIALAAFLVLRLRSPARRSS
jgi:RNA polymerase sigma factor (sigma-70 family)